MDAITLSELLLARDARAGRQFVYLRENPGKTLVCLTVNLPGSVKRDARSLLIADAGVQAVRTALQPVSEELFDLPTGFEGYFLVVGEPEQVKRTCCEVEDSHPLGRLLDLDVLIAGDPVPMPLSRSLLGMEERRCLLCGRPARECIRARTHDRAALYMEISRLLDDFANNL